MKTLQFTSLVSLLDHYDTEQKCLDALIEQRWHGKIVCPHCRVEGKVWTTNIGYRCARKECNKKFTATVGTIFESSKISLRLWFAAIYVVTSHRKGISSMQLGRDLKITQKSAWFLLARIREMLRDKSPTPFTGVVEADETYVGGKTHNKHASKRTKNAKGRSLKDKAAVLGIAERNGRVRAFHVLSTAASVVTPIIQDNVHPDARIMTDEWEAYRLLHNVYSHEFVRHGQKEFVRGECYTNTIEGFWSQLKRQIYGIHHFVTAKHLQRYCNEAAWRWNERRTIDPERLPLALSMCTGRLKYATLIQ